MAHVTYNHGVKKNGADVIGKGAVVQRIRGFQDDPASQKTSCGHRDVVHRARRKRAKTKRKQSEL